MSSVRWLIDRITRYFNGPVGSPGNPIFIFEHANAQNTEDLALIRIACRTMGWAIQGGSTNLPEHRYGIWVKGPDHSTRSLLVELLRSKDFEPTVDLTHCRQPQIIVGLRVRN